ncbi:MAG: transporter substrate-binding domain-containing protein [Hyphomicrobiales bacterium]
MMGKQALYGFICALLIFAQQTDSAYAQNQASPSSSLVPLFWRIDRDIEPPNLKDFGQLRIVTTDGYPPFNYRDAAGNMAGFNIELMQAICSTLRIQCSFAVAPFEQLFTALQNNEADVAAASISRSATNYQRADFSKPYFRSGGRFAVRVQSSTKEPTPREFSGKRLGVVQNTAHAAYLSAFFGRANVTAFPSHLEAAEALRVGQIDALFGDNMALNFWIQGEASRDCCKLVPGAFWESFYFGDGAGLATRRNDQKTLDVLNYGLDRVKISGAYDTIFRKYFALPFE